ncbi:MAG TPA: hypothetical protein ENN07_02415, partial [candidate division Zixibacteria bacterium]|nr:hypothetical protein [candidate division Zixibacteria bacterium]
GDNVLVSLWGSVDYEYNLTVDREGKIFIPRAGTVSVYGLNLDSARRAIRKALEGIYSDFQLDVTIARMGGSTVFVVGEAANPGTYNLPGMAHVIEALVLAGGPNEFGSYRNIQVYRGGRLVSRFDLYEFLLEGKTKDGVQLSSGDVVVVPRLGPTVKVRGKVRRPAIYEITDSTTFEQLLDLAGGALPEANIKAGMIDRVERGSHRILTVDFSDSTANKGFARGGDDVSFFPIETYRYDIVSLQGQVAQPGAYGLHQNMKVSDLIDGGRQLLPEAYRERADLVRFLPDRTREIISLNIERIIANPGSEEDVILQNEDLVVIYSIWDVTDREFVSIYGAVRRPGEFELFKNMRVSDLIFESGGFTPSAYDVKAELARVRPGERTQTIHVDLVDVLENPFGPADLMLEPYDILFIRHVPGWKLQDVVTIVGEVEFPGKYALDRQNERLSDLIQRAGGFTDEAFIEGAVFVRPRLADEIKNRNLHSIVRQTQEAVLDTAGDIVTSPFLFSYTPDQIARIIIDLDRVVAGRFEDDIVLEDGDSIFIPTTPTGVNVIGMVASNGTIRWVRGKRLNYYIDRAGGLTRNADAKGIRIVKANGKVVKASLRTGNIEPGDAIIVPQRIKRETDWMKTLGETVSIVSGLATTIYILLRL